MSSRDLLATQPVPRFLVLVLLLEEGGKLMMRSRRRRSQDLEPNLDILRFPLLHRDRNTTLSWLLPTSLLHILFYTTYPIALYCLFTYLEEWGWKKHLPFKQKIGNYWLLVLVEKMWRSKKSKWNACSKIFYNFWNVWVWVWGGALVVVVVVPVLSGYVTRAGWCSVDCAKSEVLINNLY